MSKVVAHRNATAFRIWFELLGYVVKPRGNGFTANTSDQSVKKRHRYVLVLSNLEGNQAALELGKEFEVHLVSPVDVKLKMVM